jgi:hypothetical protein
MEDRAKRIAVLEERDRHARDLHDGVQQVLSSLRIYALEARKALADGDLGAAGRFVDECADSIAEASDELTVAIATMRQHDDVFNDIYEVGARMRRRLAAAVEADCTSTTSCRARDVGRCPGSVARRRPTCSSTAMPARPRSSYTRRTARCSPSPTTRPGSSPTSGGPRRAPHRPAGHAQQAAQVDSELTVQPASAPAQIRCRVPLAGAWRGDAMPSLRRMWGRRGHGYDRPPWGPVVRGTRCGGHRWDIHRPGGGRRRDGDDHGKEPSVPSRFVDGVTTALQRARLEHMSQFRPRTTVGTNAIIDARAPAPR